MARRQGSSSRPYWTQNYGNRLPLSGIRVLDIGTLIAGPFGATMLGDFGAEIIKVEQPGRGDALRGSPVDGKANRSGNWLVEGRNKIGRASCRERV